MNKLVEELDRLVHPNAGLLQAARIAALITANWTQVREALLVSQFGTTGMKFYEWSQNNSGGCFTVDDNVSNRVIVEAESYDTAEEKMFSFGMYYNGVSDGTDCGCCGDRWYTGDEVELKEFATVEEYAQHITNRYGWFDENDCIIHYADGSKKTFGKMTKHAKS